MLRHRPLGRAMTNEMRLVSLSRRPRFFFNQPGNGCRGTRLLRFSLKGGGGKRVCQTLVCILVTWMFHDAAAFNQPWRTGISRQSLICSECSATMQLLQAYRGTFYYTYQKHRIAEFDIQGKTAFNASSFHAQVGGTLQRLLARNRRSTKEEK